MCNNVFCVDPPPCHRLEIAERASDHASHCRPHRVAMEGFRSSVPEPARFALSGTIGSVAFWLLNEIAVSMLPPDTPSKQIKR